MSSVVDSDPRATTTIVSISLTGTVFQNIFFLKVYLDLMLPKDLSKEPTFPLYLISAMLHIPAYAKFQLS